VTRAKAIKKTANATQRNARPIANASSNPNKVQIYNPKMSSQEQSLQGRASKLLGRAGAAHFKRKDDAIKRGVKPQQGLGAGIKTPETIVFEGYRASANNGRPKDLKLGGKGAKKGGKPKTRSSKRGTEWKKSGGKSTKE
jgi:nucleolar protein 12